MKKKKADLKIMGGRLQHSISVLTGMTLNKFHAKHRDALGMVQKSLYNLCERDDLTHDDLQVFEKLIDGFSFDYVIDDDAATKPENIYKSLRINTNKEVKNSQDDKIRELTEKLKDRDKIIALLESYNKELLEKNDKLRKDLGLI